MKMFRRLPVFTALFVNRGKVHIPPNGPFSAFSRPPLGGVRCVHTAGHPLRKPPPELFPLCKEQLCASENRSQLPLPAPDTLQSASCLCELDCVGPLSSGPVCTWVLVARLRHSAEGPSRPLPPPPPTVWPGPDAPSCSGLSAIPLRGWPASVCPPRPSPGDTWAAPPLSHAGVRLGVRVCVGGPVFRLRVHAQRWGCWGTRSL